MGVGLAEASVDAASPDWSSLPGVRALLPQSPYGSGQQWVERNAKTAQERASQGTLDAPTGRRAPGGAYECSRWNTAHRCAGEQVPRETSKSCSMTNTAPLDGPCLGGR